MHQKALSLLHEYVSSFLSSPQQFTLFTETDLTYSLSAEETDLEDKLDPAIRYLQKLGPEYIDLIFESSRWVIEADHRLGLQVRS